MSTTYTPTVTPTTPFSPNYTLPSDGDPAVVSSVNIPFENAADNIALLALRDQGLLWDVTSYGIQHGSSHDVGAAITALDLLADAQGASLWFPNGHGEGYRTTTTILKKGRSSWYTSQPGTFVYMDHPTRALLQLDTASVPDPLYGQTSPQAVIEGFFFLNIQPNTGDLIYSPAAFDSNVQFRNCVFGEGTDTRGLLLDQLGAQAVLYFDDLCVFRLYPSQNACLLGGGRTYFGQGTRFAVPDTFGGKDVIQVTGTAEVWLDQPNFDGTSRSTGGAWWAFGLGAGTVNVMLNGGRFVDRGGALTVFRQVVVGSQVIQMGGGPCFYSGAVPYDPASVPTFADLSSLQVNAPLLRYSGSTTLLTNLTSHQVYKTAVTSAPTLTLPNGAFSGQSFELTLSNGSGSSWSTPTFLNVSEYLCSLPTLTSGASSWMRFVWMDLQVDGTYTWVLVTSSAPL